MTFSLEHLLRDSAARYPDQIAVQDGSRSITYADLDHESDRLAAYLCERGVGPGDRVGLLFPKRLESIVSVFGILKSGAVYVPVDARAPASRAAYILGNCAIRGLITTGSALPALRDAGFAQKLAAVVLVDEEASDGLPEGACAFGAWPSVHVPHALERGIIDTDLAYILYTSGSTGEPKGVMLSHRHALTFINWAAGIVELDASDRVSSHAPLHFDLSVFDIFASIKAGATIVLVPASLSVFPVRLSEFIEGQRISVWYSVPSALTLMLTKGKLERFSLANLRTVIFAGEVFPTKYVRMLRGVLPGSRLLNWYGPTETNVCTYYEVPYDLEAIGSALPIGRACANTDVFALTSDGRRARSGEEGELVARGSTLMSGYWGRAERSAQSLVQNPLHDDFPDVIYRTGDIVRLNEDGNYDFLGRRDNMVKSRGYRIELGEVESALHRHDIVLEAAVVAVPDEDIGCRLFAWVVACDGETLSESELRRHCASVLPHYMVPELFMIDASLPKTSTGKCDRQAVQERALTAVRQAQQPA